jgi:hypothetical protein
LTNHGFLTRKDKPLNFIMKRLTDHLPKKTRIQKITLNILTNHGFLTRKDKPLNFIMKRLTDHLPQKILHTYTYKNPKNNTQVFDQMKILNTQRQALKFYN